MIIYILAIPVFSFLIPIYAFWHFDDFSWGNTRIVVGDKGQKKAVGPEEGKFDLETIPTKTWSEHEQEMMEQWESESHCSKHSKDSECSCENHEEEEYEHSHHSHSRCSSIISSLTHSHYHEDEQVEDGTSSLYSKCSTPNNLHHHQQRQQSVGSVMSHNPGHHYYNYNNSSRNGGVGSYTTDSFNGPNFSRAPSFVGSYSFFAFPTDAVIIQEVEKILDHNDLMQLTKKQVRDTLSDTFGVDMACKKDFINRCIDQSLSVRL